MKGRYYKEGEQPGPDDERPLYLLVSADTEEQLGKAVDMIEKMMRQPSVCEKNDLWWLMLFSW